MYPNSLKAMLLTGAEVQEWIEMSAGQFNQIDPKGAALQSVLNDSFRSFNFDTLDGVSDEIDVTQPARYNADGTLDTSFNGTGLREISLRGPVKSSAVGAVRQSDGKIVAAGNVGVSTYDQNFSLARFLHDGSLDGSFGEQGMVVTDFLDRQDAPTAITVQTDGRLLVTGYVAVPPGNVKDIGVVRYTVAGALDSSFGVGGKVRLDVDGDVDIARAISVQVDGRILLAGDSTYPSLGSAQNLTLLRLMADGSRDTAFGTNGVANVSVATFDFGTALAVQSDGKILVGGRGSGDFSLVRFTTTGVLDTTFGNNGKVTFDFAGQTDVLNALLIVPDWNAQGERILAVGSARSSSSSSSEAFASGKPVSSPIIVWKLSSVSRRPWLISG